MARKRKETTKAYAAWAFSAKLQRNKYQRFRLNDDGEIGKVTICDNKVIKRKRKKKGGIEGKQGIL